jgi:DNA-directed RNA polymerase subunit beta'
MHLANDVKKKDLGLIITEVFNRYSTKKTSEILDQIKDLGFKYSTIAGMTVSLADINVAPNKQKYVEHGKRKSC